MKEHDIPDNILSTVQCNSCNFKFDVYGLEFGKTECPSCFSKKLTLLDQKKPSDYFTAAIRDLLGENMEENNVLDSNSVQSD